MAEKQTKHVSKEKIEAVKKIADAMKSAKTVMLVSIKNLPSNQLQKIKKDLRGKASMQVAKKSALVRAVDATGIKELDEMKKHIQEDCALLISNDDAFGLSGWFAENRNPIGAKEGQIAESDITIEEGPTELVPGPVISELGALGLAIMVEDGKITIRKSKVAVKKGEKVSGAASSIFQKLGIKPFMIGITPLVFYDGSSKKVFVGIKVNKKEMLNEVLSAHAKAVGFAVNVAYPTQATIGMLLAKANAHHAALIKLSNKTQ